MLNALAFLAFAVAAIIGIAGVGSVTVPVLIGIVALGLALMALAPLVGETWGPAMHFRTRARP